MRTNFTIPDVKSIALGGGSLIRTQENQTFVGPDSVGAQLEEQAISFGGEKLTVGVAHADYGAGQISLNSFL